MTMTKLTLKKMQNIASSRGGKCLSSNYFNVDTKLTWQCSKGHIWKANPRNIIHHNSWCPKCSYIIRFQAYRKLKDKEGKQKKWTIEQMRIIAQKKGGKCLSEEYVNTTSYLKWQCINGHRWKAALYSIRNGRWCPTCAKESGQRLKYRYTLEDAKRMAEKNMGKCLSKTYIDYNSKLKWQCAKGHVWDTPIYNILDGTWCRLCSYPITRTKTKLSLEDIRKDASKKDSEL